MTACTLQELIARSIESEKAAGGFYFKLASKFPEYTSLAAAWQKLGQEEASYIRWLEDFARRLPFEVLNQTLNPQVVAKFQFLSDETLQRHLERIKFVEDAFPLILSVGQVDTNSLLISMYDLCDKKSISLAILRDQTLEHIIRKSHA